MLQHTTTRRGTAGFAIPAAIVVMVVVSLLALSGLYVARNNSAANNGLRMSTKALYAADAAAQDLISDWRQLDFRTLAPGDSTSTGWRNLSNGATYQTSVLRVDDGADPATGLFRLRTAGRPGAGLTAQRVVITMVDQAVPSGLCCDAAMKLQGRLRIQGTGAGVKVSGVDTDPTGWGGHCSGTSSDVPGVTMPDQSLLDLNGSPILEGSPAVFEDTSISPDEFVDFGDITYTDLAAMADHQIASDQIITSVGPQTAAGGECLESSPTNWGDPLNATSACFDYMPIIHVNGDLRISGNGIGQGILLVDGDFEVTGDFEFYGVVVVLGQADFKGSTELHGGLAVRNGVNAGDESYLRGGTTLQYSSCSATRAMGNAVIARPLAGRHWFEVVE
jgi:type II secretory pathway pseudopilin PulG